MLDSGSTTAYTSMIPESSSSSSDPSASSRMGTTRVPSGNIVGGTCEHNSTGFTASAKLSTMRGAGVCFRGEAEPQFTLLLRVWEEVDDFA